jgi:uncharacterized protein (DUF2252 family)
VERDGAGPPDRFAETPEERVAIGKALREKVPREAHATWAPAAKRRDPVDALKHGDQGRLSDLIPIRYGRMRMSPFDFFRGSAALMAADLAGTPVTGWRVQACGDCHISNFGGYASPERRLIFDINDFDETLPAPWEWDIKRLAASVFIAGRELGAKDLKCADATREVARSYRRHIRDYARMGALEVWYSSLDAEILIAEAVDRGEKKRWEAIEDEAKSRTPEHMFPKITDVRDGEPRIVDSPPLVYHPKNYARGRKFVVDLFHRYRMTLPEERRVVLDRYRIVDVARKVVGVGSVGTRCAVILLMAAKTDPLFLQFKESRASVLEPYAGKSRYPNQGQRVVTGQRMLQSSSDVFLGWTRGDDGLQYYFRQLQDMKMKLDFAALQWEDWMEYVGICGWALARAHARTGDPARMAGYLGKNDTFDKAIEKFAIAYADQNERDYDALRRAIKVGRVQASAAA